MFNLPLFEFSRLTCFHKNQKTINCTGLQYGEIFGDYPPPMICISPPKNVANSWLHHCSSSEAVNRIYEIKGRKHTSPLAICVGDVEDINRFAVTDHLPYGLLNSLLPGPVTVVLKRGLSLKYLKLCKKEKYI